MPFIGNQPALSYTSFAKQDFTTSATTSYTLDNPVANANELALFINFVRQEPTTAYSASGTTLTLTSATSASDDMYCVFLGKAVQTVNPPSGSVGLSQLSATGTKDSTTFLRGDNTFAVAGGDNTPAFMAYNPQNGSVASGTNVVLSLNTELFDTDSVYDTSTYKFTPQVAGYYFFYANVRWQGSTNSATRLNLDITKNGSSFANSRNSNSDYATTNATGVCYLNGSTDYVQLESYHNFAGSTGITTALNNTYLGGYKLIT
jgi:hypothetical protein